MYAYADAEKRLSERLTLTPEGFLHARNAVLARTGEQEYHVTEVPTLDADSNGWIVVTRPEHEVFDPRSLASFVGRPIVLEHPDDEGFVHPENVRQLQIGTVLNARRGDGDLRDCVVGDLMFTDKRAIELIRRGAYRSLSAGYDAQYTQHSPGRAEQRSIRINHLALLRNGSGRRGDKCAVLDRRPQPPRRPVVTDAMRAQRRAHEQWSRARMREIVEAHKQFWNGPQHRA
jgi:hypothetical protein